MHHVIEDAADGESLPPWSVDRALPQRLATIGARLEAIEAEAGRFGKMAAGTTALEGTEALERERLDLAEARWAIGRLREVEAVRAEYIAARTEYPDRDRNLETLDREIDMLIHAITVYGPDHRENEGTRSDWDDASPF